jgi:hypothetical protein
LGASKHHAGWIEARERSIVGEPELTRVVKA